MSATLHLLDGLRRPRCILPLVFIQLFLIFILLSPSGGDEATGSSWTNSIRTSGTLCDMSSVRNSCTYMNEDCCSIIQHRGNCNHCKVEDVHHAPATASVLATTAPATIGAKAPPLVVDTSSATEPLCALAPPRLPSAFDNSKTYRNTHHAASHYSNLLGHTCIYIRIWALPLGVVVGGPLSGNKNNTCQYGSAIVHVQTNKFYKIS